MKNKTIKITLTDEEDVFIAEQAMACGIPKSAYIKDMALTGKVINSMSEATANSICAILYTLSEQAEDMETKNSIKKAADQIWQHLK